MEIDWVEMNQSPGIVCAFYGLMLMTCVSASEFLQSPCPDFFEYKYENQAFSGIIEVPAPSIGTPMHMRVNLSLKGRVPGAFVGTVSLDGSREEAIQGMITGTNVRYRVKFPVKWPIPKVTSIILNNQIICVGPPEKARITTMLKLEHDLYTAERAKVLRIAKELNEKDSIVIPPPPAPRRYERETTCGTSAPLRQLIMGGKAVSRGEFPWLVAIFILRDENLKFICGGTLISSQVVVTAAHCVFSDYNKVQSPENVLLVLGKHYFHDWTEEGATTAAPSKIIAHPDYQHGVGIDADLALITLRKPVTFTNLIRPICLWEPELWDTDEIHGTVIGWGRNKNEKISKVTKRLEIDVVSQTTCVKSHPDFSVIISTRTFCAGNIKSARAESPCNGDSGGPFMIRKRGQWYLKGVISSSLIDPETGVCDAKNYSIFTDLVKFYDWIRETMKEE